MTVRVKRPNGDWDEIVGGHVDHHDRGGSLHVQTETEPVFYEAADWEAFEVLPEVVVDPAVEIEDRVFPDGFV